MEQGGWREWIVRFDETFMSFLAGFFDADGSIFFHKKREGGGFELVLSNLNRDLLGAISNRLVAMGFSPRLRLDRQSPDRGVTSGGDSIYRLSLWRYTDMTAVLGALPLRNREKAMKAQIALSLPYWSSSDSRRHVIERWNSLRASIRTGRDECIHQASVAFAARKASDFD